VQKKFKAAMANAGHRPLSALQLHYYASSPQLSTYMGIRINIAVNLSLNRSQCGATAVEKYSSGLLWSKGK
jgi:hypothetical protein